MHRWYRRHVVGFARVLVAVALIAGCSDGDPPSDSGMDASPGDASMDASDTAADASPDSVVIDTGIPLVQSCDDAMDLGSTLGVPVTTGTTVGESDDVTPECALSARGAPDVVFRWTAPSTGRFVFDTYGSSFDTVLHIRDADCSLVGCEDDPTSRIVLARVVAELNEGDVLFVAVDGTGGSAGEFALNISEPPENEADCLDGVDEDRDGTTDCADLDCLPEAFCHEDICDDDIDNDGDGSRDCGDFDCVFVEPCSETTCGDAVDNDFDGAVDCDDIDCASFEPCRETVCDDTVDADMDGMTDCADDDCTCDPACGAMDTCPDGDLGSALGTGVARGSLPGRCDTRQPASLCTGPFSGAGPDIAFSWTAPADGEYSFDTIGSDFDTTLYLLDGTCDAETLACNDDYLTVTSRLVTTLSAGQTVIVVVDTYSPFAPGGDFFLSILPIE